MIQVSRTALKINKFKINKLQLTEVKLQFIYLRTYKPATLDVLN